MYNPHLTEQKIINENNKQIVPKLRFDASIVDDSKTSHSISQNATLPATISESISSLPPISTSFSPPSVNYLNKNDVNNFNADFSFQQHVESANPSHQHNSAPNFSAISEITPAKHQIQTNKENRSQEQDEFDDLELEIESLHSNSQKNYGEDPNNFGQVGNFMQLNDSLSIKRKEKAENLVEILNRKIEQRTESRSKSRESSRQIMADKVESAPKTNPVTTQKSTYLDLKNKKEQQLQIKRTKTPNLSYYQNKAKNKTQSHTNQKNTVRNLNQTNSLLNNTNPYPNTEQQKFNKQHNLMSNKNYLKKDSNNNNAVGGELDLGSIIKPMKKNYYQKMSSSKFMQKYDETLKNKTPRRQDSDLLGEVFALRSLDFEKPSPPILDLKL